MRLLSLKIRRMPGFKEKGFRYEEGILKEGINVIVGSNGSGKTTSCMAVRKLLWPHHPSVKHLTPVSLQASFEEDGKLFEVDIEGGHYHGFSFTTAPLEQNALCYTVLLDDLFHATDDVFAHVIAKIAYGGCDLDLVRKQFAIAPRMGLKEKKQLYEKKRKLEEISRHHLELEREEESLKGIAEQIHESKKAQEALKKIKIFSDLLIKEKILQDVNQALDTLPVGSAYAREEDEWEYQQIILKEGGEGKISCLDDFQLLELEGKIHLLQDLERDLREVKNRTLEMEVGFKERFSLLGVDKDNFPQMKVDHVGELQRLWECWHAKVCELSEWDARIKAVASQKEPLYSPQSLREGIRLLHAFLHAEELKWFNRLLWATPFLSLSLYKYPYACMGVSFFAFCLILLLKKSSSGFFKRAFLEQGIPSPESFSQENVRQHIPHLEKMWGEATRFFHDKETAQIIAVHKVKCSREADHLYQGLQEAGFPTEKLSWIPFVRELQRASELFIEVKKQEALIREKEVRYHALLQEINVKNAREGAVLLNFYEKNAQRQKELNELAFRKNEILTRCKICAENFEEEWKLLSACVEKREAYLTLMREKTALEMHVKEMHKKLSEDLDFFKSKSKSLQMLQEEAEAKALMHDHLIETQAAIRQKLDSAANRLAFEEASSELKEAEEVLQKVHQEFVRKALGEFLIGKIEKLFENEFQPEVFKRASGWFVRFTKGAYRLQFLKKRSFVAYDVNEEEVKDLDALSRGTRIQLILAIRLAFMETAEAGGHQLPLFLDEVMSHADDERFQYMAEALLEIAKRGRQIFYFTCQRGCVDAWGKIEGDLELLNVIDLDKMKQGLACFETPIRPLKVACPIPTPEGKTLYDYSKELSLPGLCYNSPPSSWHLCHFANCSSELHELLIQNVFVYGQFKNLSEKGLLKFPKFMEKGKLAEQFYALAQVGRGRKVTLEELQQGGVSEKFLDKVYLVAKNYNFEPKKLLLGLKNREIQGFREKTREELQEFLLESGCLDMRETLEKDEIRARLWQFSKEEACSLSLEETAFFINTLCELL
ncbi:MAG: hypothetical protein V4494_04650 [Chlamydiota bacterium]